MPTIAATHAAKQSAHHAKRFLNISKPTHMPKPRTRRTRPGELCELEAISDRKQEDQKRFGNQPENPARGYNSAKGNIPYMYITCQVNIIVFVQKQSTY